MMQSVLVVGDDVRLWFRENGTSNLPEHSVRHRQLFGYATTALLRRLRVAVVGCSGTGSPVVEQLARLGVGELILIDPKRVEEKNLNRIVGSTLNDARERRLKVEVLKRSVTAMGLETRVMTLPLELATRAAVQACAGADVAIGCMDSASGRNLLNRICRYYLVPYIDVGVKLEAGKEGLVDEVAGSIHYVRPDGAELVERGLFSREQVEAEDLARENPAEYAERYARGYIRGIQAERPAVVSVNAVFAGLAVTELLARLHPFRLDSNASAASTRLSLAKGILDYQRDADLTPEKTRQVARGDVEPLLDMPSLGS